MTMLKAGDRVECRIQAGTIVSAYNDCDEIRTFEIVAVDDNGYYLYVPHYIYLNGGMIADANRCRRLGIEKRFMGEKVIYIATSSVYGVISQIDGLSCNRCNDFFSMAQSNQPDETFLCWSCKNNPYR